MTSLLKLRRNISTRFSIVRESEDQGIAMIMVMGMIIVLSLLLAATFSYAQAVEPQAKRDSTWNAALAAAQAGVDDYVAKLNANDNYWQSIDCTNVALRGPNAGTNNCSWTSGTAVGWQNVSADDATAGQFHYDVDSSVINSQGAVRLTSTGKVGGSSRTIQVLVSRGGSTDFLYYTDFEDADPSNTAVYPTGAPNADCGSTGPAAAKYWWNGRTSTDSCVEIQFVTGDTLDGKVHFNDTPLINGTTSFLQGYETSTTSCKNTPYAVTNCKRGTGTPNLNGNKATYADPLSLPDNATNFTSYPGCQYTGDTRIKFNADGTMTVWSTRSAGTNTSNDGSTCGTFTGTSSVTVPVPTDKTIYVKNWTSAAKCTTGQVGDGLPVAGDVNVDNSTFFCGNGNVYIEGTVKGRVSIAAQNNVVVTGDLLIDGVTAGATPSGTSVTGLVAGNSVVVEHPVKCTATSGSTCTTYANIDTTGTNRYIYASIQTLQRSFWVQSYDKGAQLGTLTVYGSIAQKWRGIVGTGSTTGYLKNYRYDSRLRFQAPPYFPQWTNAVWAGRTTGEIKPAY
ncbi:MAG: hypothetical protein WCL12_00170 [Actinomycetes bacterium]|jgi:hypothetical protein